MKEILRHEEDGHVPVMTEEVAHCLGIHLVQQIVQNQ